ncbi:hypothetical protein HPB51_012009 [Rhipicephalus microplus]|uniref:Uncharacterized protein n=1 Tax=Rhipicephalus microplus TaxID=6941 RepID=A0A9J6F1J3_RHIMP|nr:hypothetical protein HPB51_012009 [Rhipicephalus microplus]
MYRTPPSSREPSPRRGEDTDANQEQRTSRRQQGLPPEYGLLKDKGRKTKAMTATAATMTTTASQPTMRAVLQASVAAATGAARQAVLSQELGSRGNNPALARERASVVVLASGARRRGGRNSAAHSGAPILRTTRGPKILIRIQPNLSARCEQPRSVFLAAPDAERLAADRARRRRWASRASSTRYRPVFVTPAAVSSSRSVTPSRFRGCSRAHSTSPVHAYGRGNKRNGRGEEGARLFAPEASVVSCVTATVDSAFVGDDGAPRRPRRARKGTGPANDARISGAHRLGLSGTDPIPLL